MTRNLIINSIKNYEQIQGVRINKDTIQAEIINLTCKFILEKHKDKIRQVDDVYSVNQVIQYNIMSVGDIIYDFVESCQELYPNLTHERNPYVNLSWEDSMVQLIAQNICWRGMWGFLREYYLNTHRLNIDNVKIDVLLFSSAKHKRYQNNIFVSESGERRIIKATFTNNRKQVSISIEPSLSPKTAFFYSKINENTDQYIGDDRDYQFIIKYDDFGDITQFELVMPNRSLKIIYNEH